MFLELLIVFFAVLLLPLSSRIVEKNLEMFLFAMGLLAAVLSGVLNRSLFVTATFDPINISIAVFAAGLLFKWFQMPLEKMIIGFSRIMPYRIYIAITIIFLGLISSIITAIIASLVLVLIVTTLRLERKCEVRFVVLACFAIGLGAASTPIGEPLSTIAVSKLDEDFFFLIRLVGSDIISALVILGLAGAIFINPPTARQGMLNDNPYSESYEEILIRSLKVYFFVMGLTFLGAGFEPLINTYFLKLDASLLYWINMISAILDNATLAAAEISPEMDDVTIRSILLGLLISGGMLIPGNIPNIIAAGKLQITSKEWASFGVPLGLVMMLLYFFFAA